MKSINLYAETLLLHLAKAKEGNCTVESGCKALSTFWKNKGMDISGLHLEDGSGLSRANVITTEQLVFVLQYMKTKSEYSESFLRSLPVAGTSGSLKSFGLGTNLVGNLRAKSGYMSRVMSYAGYLTTESGQQLAFAVMINNYNCTNSEMRKMLEGFLASICRYESP
jgi:D-alanyl-D-alanine carboxypeptidase/D-alanyl-D-alanine-endopeptidase (penicillin-binding protein 4)